ncbi:MAG: antibiotic biosynthesis monooxygenase [Pseudomonadota bacterium]
MGVMVIAVYRPKPGREEVLEALVRRHHGVLAEEGLVDETPVLAGRARDGAVIEVFIWKSQDAIDAAHENPAVKALWDEFEGACEYDVIANVAEAKEMFSPFTAIDLTKET